MGNLFKYLAILLCCISTFVLTFHVLMITITAFYTNNANMQIYLFVLFSLIFILSFLSILFIKCSNKLKVIFLFVILVFECLFIKYSLSIPAVNKIVDIQYCIDKGDVWDKTKNECIE